MIQLLTILSLFYASLSQTVNPSHYIWLQYGKIDKKPLDEKYVIIEIPCRSRIGSCSYQYSLIPLGWEPLPNGQIKVPRSDLTDLRTYSIQVLLTEPTGERIEASLIADVQNSQVKIVNRADFYESFSYKPNLSSILNPRKNSPTNPNPGQSTSKSAAPKITEQKSDLKDAIPVEQVMSILRSGNAVKISVTVGNIIGLKIDCSSKLKYLSQILEEIRIQKIKNEGKVQIFENEVLILKEEIQKLQMQQKVLQANKNNEVQNKSYQEKIKVLENKKNEAQAKQRKNQAIANNYLNAIKQQTQNMVEGKMEPEGLNNTETDEMELKLDEMQLQKINAAIKEMMERKYELQRSIIEKKYQAEVQKFKKLPSNIDSLQEKYREYSENAVKAKIAYDNAQYEISALKNRGAQNEKSEKLINEAIKKLEKQLQDKNKVGDGRKIEDVSNLIQLLQNTMESITKSKDKLEEQCPANL